MEKNTLQLNFHRITKNSSVCFISVDCVTMATNASNSIPKNHFNGGTRMETRGKTSGQVTILRLNKLSVIAKGQCLLIFSKYDFNIPHKTKKCIFFYFNRQSLYLLLLLLFYKQKRIIMICRLVSLRRLDILLKDMHKNTDVKNPVCLK